MDKPIEQPSVEPETTPQVTPTVSEKPTIEVSPAPQPKMDKKKWLAVVICVVLVLLLGLLLVGRLSKKEQKLTTSTQQKRQITVSASSDIPYTTFSIKDEKKLVNYLNENGIFSSIGVRILNSYPIKKTSVKSLMFILTQVNQPYDRITGPNKKITSSYGQEYTEGDKSMKILLNISPEYLAGMKNNHVRTLYINRKIAGIIYDITQSNIDPGGLAVYNPVKQEVMNRMSIPLFGLKQN